MMSLPVKKEPGSNSSSGPGSVGSMLEVKKEPGAGVSGSAGVSAKAQLASKVKLAVVQAWRERWSEIQWSIQLKKLLAAYSGETVDIAEILMQRAVVGSTPVSLILSYLKHSVLSQMIPFNTVLKYITEFEDFSRPHCVLALLHLAEMFGSKISLSPCPDSALQLMRTMLRLIHWLLKALLSCLQRLQDNRPNQVASEYFVIIDNSSRAISNILERRAVRSLMQVARADSAEEYREFEQCEMNVRGTLTQLSPASMSEDTREKINNALMLLSKMEEQQLVLGPVLEVLHAPIYPTISGLVALEAIFNTNSDVQPFVDQILMVSRLMKLSMPQMCLEMFRACFMGFLDTSEYTEDLQWATFIFLKLPHILSTMRQQMPDWDVAIQVEKGIDMLMEYSHLLDQTDIKQNYDMLSQFINELHRANIISEAQKNILTQKRLEQRSKLRRSDITGSSDAKNLSRVSHAESTVTSILKSLDSDPLKTSESMVKVLTIMHQGHSFDMLRLAAASTGRLGDFITKLIRMNEFASQNSGEALRIPNKSQLFDITFLMITSIFQQSGVEIAAPNRENEYTLVYQWAKRWLPEEGRYKNCEFTVVEDQDKVDAILNLLLSSSEIAPCGRVNSWKELIMYLPYALQEVLYALEHKAFGIDKVKSIIEHLRRQSTKSLVVVCTAYLCSYMNMVGAVARAKPLAMLEFLTAPQGAENKQPVQVIIDNIVFDILPEGHPQRPLRRYLLSNKKLSSEIMNETLKESFHRGWLTMCSLHTLEQLLALRGPDWFCREMVEHLLKQSHIDDMSQSLSLAFAIMHLDLERLTISLLQRVLPQLLTTPQTNTLTDPRGYCLAKLCVLSVTATHTSKIGQKDVYVRRLHKRTVVEADLEDDLDDSETSPAKLRKFSEPQLTFSLEEFNLEALAEKEDGEALPTFDMKEPLNKALVNLFMMMNTILLNHSLTPRTWFIVSFIQEAIKCGGQHTRFILQFMPQNMLNQLMRSLPGVFSDDHILHICDLSTVSGRKIAAKAICNNTLIPQLDIFD
ncbi:mediator of RNA polymerase II transcription subunit 24 isoform X2 [Aplysia californica]|uniref:Mediator of RNA polymerase II transcription subunit 24 n=1 Tax=Aplysia californica TaxID=6500 RepID=A0ABM1A9X3_APLCA|nr:mediator of RNA polymerase II transcription subunit 24 isoform X2 [Aplysia californica]